jgi:predicted kinase
MRRGKKATKTNCRHPGSLVLINGLPGSGKSTLAGALADALGFPLFSKDAYKESLWPGSVPPDAAASSALGRRALGRLWADVAAQPGPAVVESFWFARRDRDFVLADLAAARRMANLELWCDVDPAMARQRCRSRPRHPVHHPVHDDDVLWAEWAGNAGPLDLGTVLQVDTARPVDVPALSRQVGQLLGLD